MTSISVVIPAYAHAHIIAHTIRSVLNQTQPPDEIIVINDGSPDDTTAAVAPFLNDDRFRFLEQPNEGQAAARNRGIAIATSDYVALLDDDDLWPPGKLAWQKRLLDDNPQAVMVYGEYLEFREDQPHKLITPVRTDRHHGKCHRAFTRCNCIYSPGQTLIRRDHLLALHGFDETIWGADDWDLYIRLAKRGEVLYDNRPALYYRVHARNASGNALRLARGHLAVVRKHLGRHPLRIRRQLQRSAGFFVPRLDAYAERALAAGRWEDARDALRLTLLFHPRRCLSLRTLRRALASRPPRQLDDATAHAGR